MENDFKCKTDNIDTNIFYYHFPSVVNDITTCPFARSYLHSL